MKSLRISQASVPSFFDLPRELRDSIYNDILDGVKCKITFSDRKIRSGLGTNFILFYERYDDKGSLEDLPRGLFACKQMLDEAFELLYDHARCTLGTTCNCPGCIEVDGRCQYHSWNSLSLDQVKRFDGPIQDGSWDAEGIFCLHESGESTFEGSPTFFVPYTTRVPRKINSVSEGFFKYLQERPNHPAKVIKFSISLSRSDQRNMMATGPVDLSCFRSLGSGFDRVIFRIVCPYGDPTSLTDNEVHLRNTALMFARLHFEAARTAVFMVGGSDNSGYDLQDSCKVDIASTLFDCYVEAKRDQSGQNFRINHAALQFVKTENTSLYQYLPFAYFGRKQLRDEIQRGDVRWSKIEIDDCQDPYRPFPWILSSLVWPMPLEPPANWHIKDIAGLQGTSKALQRHYARELQVLPEIDEDSYNNAIRSLGLLT